jgi:hypothetical protein
MPAFLASMDTYALATTVQGYSSGTRCELLNYTKAHTAFVSIFATKEVLEVSQDDIVRLRPRYRIVTVDTSDDQS